VAVSSDGALAVVSDYGAEVPGRTLTVIDLRERRVTRTIDLGDYRRPHGLAWIGKSARLLVTAEAQAALLEVDIEQGKVVRAIPTRANASHMVAATPDGSRAFVANIASGSVTAIDLAQGELLASIETGAGCEGIDVSPDGREVWTANRDAGSVTVLDARELSVLATLEAPGFPIRVKLTPDGKRALVSCAEAGEVVVFDVHERELVASIGMHPLREGTAGDEHMFGQGFGESTVPIGIQIHPDGTTAWVANSAVGRVAVLDLGGLALRESFQAGRQPDGLGFASRP
jgi:sugar lactone lactonase YvrE